MHIKSNNLSNSIIPETAISLILISCAFYIALLFNLESKFNIISGKLYKYINLPASNFLFYFFIITCFLLVLYHGIFSYFKYIFLAILLTSFSLSMVNVSILSNYSFLLRNLSSVLLISVGIIAFVKYFRTLSLVEYLCLFYMSWCIINIYVNGFNVESVLYLQFIVALTLGVIIGYKHWHFKYNIIDPICKIVAWAGIFLTIFNLSSLFISAQPFLGMRFRSYYNLPTSFANNYVIFYIALIWFAMQDISLGEKMLVYFSLFIGIILIVISGTRNSLLSLFVGFLVLSYIKGKGKKYLLVYGSILITILFFLIYFDIGNINKYLLHYNEINTSNRNSVWILSVNNAIKKYFWGYGIGKEMEVLGKYQNEWEQFNSHNAFLGIWLQVGFVGAITILIIYIIAIYRGVVLIKSVSEKDKNNLIFAIAILLSLFVAGIAEDNLTSRGSIQQLMWGVSIGIICKIRYRYSIQHENMEHKLC